MSVKNQDIRLAIYKSGKRQYEVAEILGMQESNFSALLRKDLTPEQREKILQAIEQK